MWMLRFAVEGHPGSGGGDESQRQFAERRKRMLFARIPRCFENRWKRIL
jgi:hypothetical protein